MLCLHMASACVLRHEAEASQEPRSGEEIRQAFIDVMPNLQGQGFSFPAKNRMQEPQADPLLKQLEIHFLTPRKYLDIINVEIGYSLEGACFVSRLSYRQRCRAWPGIYSKL